MTFHEIWSIIIPSIVGIIGILSGIWIGQHLSDRKEEKQKADEIEKIRYFLNADFSLVQRTLKKMKMDHIQMQDTIITKNQSDVYMLTRKTLEKLLTNLRIKTGYFSYWDLLVTSGSLIKLEPDELRIVESTHHSISEYRRIETQSSDSLNDQLIKIFLEKSLTTQDKKEIIKGKCELYFQGLFQTYEYIQERLDVLKNNIPWINLETEPIIAKNKPKMKIDSKGTYSFE
jgi:hypothetical protein